jgi:hypothetical protein
MGKCLQYFFAFVNFLVFLGGAALTALCIWLLVDPDSLSVLVDDLGTDNNTEIPETFDDIIGKVKGSLYFALATGKNI